MYMYWMHIEHANEQCGGEKFEKINADADIWYAMPYPSFRPSSPRQLFYHHVPSCRITNFKYSHQDQLTQEIYQCRMYREGIRTEVSVRFFTRLDGMGHTLGQGLLTRRTRSLNAPTPMIELPSRQLISLGKNLKTTSKHTVMAYPIHPHTPNSTSIHPIHRTNM